MAAAFSTEILETIEAAREYLQDGYIAADTEALADDFAGVILQLAEACLVGLPCPKHDGAVHGQEAEELRAGVERIVADTGACDAADVRKAIFRLLDHVVARDSLVYLEKKAAYNAIVDAVLDADILTLPSEVRAARLAYEHPVSGLDE